MIEEIAARAGRSETSIHVSREGLRRLGAWSATRRYTVRADRSRIVLDLREACRRFTGVTVTAELVETTLILLVEDGTQVRNEVEWSGKGTFKDRWGHGENGAGTLTVLGSAQGSEVRIHRGGVAVLDDLTSWERLRELRGQEGATEVEHVAVLVVGGGYAGTAMVMFLAQNGIRALMVDRHDQPGVQGRARGVNQRTMELYRAAGMSREVEKLSAPFAGDAGVARCASLSEPWEWLFDPEPDPRLEAISPARFVMADQNTVEPVLTDQAREWGARIERGVAVEQVTVNDTGAEATLRNLANGTTRRVRCDYLIAADGYASGIRESLGIGRDGPQEAQDWVSIIFDADLDDLVERRALFWIVLNQQLGFASLTTTADPNRWSLGLTFDPTTTPLSSFDTDKCVDLIRTAVGDRDRPVRVVDVTPWQQAVGVAAAYRHQSAFLVGDAAHVWPPAGAMGANSGIQDAHNLAWKLAAVLDGRADPVLLDSYEAERRPVAQALADLTVRRQAARFSGGPDDDVDDIVCTFGQRYHSGAVLGATGTFPFADAVADVAEPGARMPHTWIDTAHKTSLLDLTGTEFVLAVADHADEWRQELDAEGVRVQQVDPDALPKGAGAALIRPDGYVAWIAGASELNAEAVRDAIGEVLGSTAHAEG
ncbi:FAD-dependent monooxygenase [Humibacter sp. RRB41]|uniref:FAD-dependent monooxygenase n=1 Tax=Humibacter sp. RRB41 TaxID=2919946 RepID=UPI001FA96679|nr:FAD-dependent monooxygenase [Humibacter sp. RRB41]